MSKQSRSKLNIPMCAAAVLFCLTLFSMHFTSGLYAKYSTRSEGEDSARVIKFGTLALTETGDFADGSAFIIPGVDLTKKAVVSFGGSESATYVFVKIELSGGWTKTGNSFSINGLSWSVADGWSYLDGSEYVYYRALAPNDTLSDADIISDGGKITVSDEITKSEIASMTGIKIDLTAYVVQSNGFDSVTEAWASVSAKS